MEKCKMNIKENKERIQQLSEENESLRKQIEGGVDEVCSVV
ncbi:unnamed protein product [Anisakis simplex]|uniref:Uncharacterized protein n=1 Tax=Anisakis simplex TaxID=6269 RepID=A0A3P6PVT4_ANISI|nr:unnamed protein product [Anisakis simplex]